MSALVGLLAGLASELDQQPARALRQELELPEVEALPLHEADELVVDPLEADRPVAHDLGYGVGGLVYVGVAEHQRRPGRRTVDEAKRRLEHGHAGSLRAYERARHVEPVLGQELVQVVARDPARDVGITLADQVAVAVADRAKAGVDLAAPAAFGDQPLELILARLSDPHPKPVVGEDLEVDDVLLGLARHDRVDAA